MLLLTSLPVHAQNKMSIPKWTSQLHQILKALGPSPSIKKASESVEIRLKKWIDLINKNDWQIHARLQTHSNSPHAGLAWAWESSLDGSVRRRTGVRWTSDGRGGWKPQRNLTWANSQRTIKASSLTHSCSLTFMSWMSTIWGRVRPYHFPTGLTSRDLPQLESLSEYSFLFSRNV